MTQIIENNPVTELRAKAYDLMGKYETTTDELITLDNKIRRDFDITNDDVALQQELESAILEILTSVIINTALPIESQESTDALQKLTDQFQNAYNNNPTNFTQLAALAEWILLFLKKQDSSKTDNFIQALQDYLANAASDSALKNDIFREFLETAVVGIIGCILALLAVAVIASLPIGIGFSIVAAVVLVCLAAVAFTYAFYCYDESLNLQASLKNNKEQRVNERAVDSQLVSTRPEDNDKSIVTAASFFTSERQRVVTVEIDPDSTLIKVCS